MREVHVSTMREAACVYRWEVNVCAYLYMSVSEAHVDSERM